MIPKRLLPNVVTVKPFLGSGPYGDKYGPPVEVQCRVEWQRKLVRTKSGTEAMSGATVYAQPGPNAPKLSDVIALPGETRERTVINEARPTGARDIHHVVVDVD